MPKKLIAPLLFLTFSIWVNINNDLSDYWCRDRHFQEYQDGIMNHTIYGPLAYRVMIPYTIDFFYRVIPQSLLPEDKQSAEKRIDFFLNIIALLLVQLAFYRYLQNFFSPVESFFGTLWLDLSVLMSLTAFIGVHVYETSDMVNLLWMIMALNLLYRQRWILLILVLFLSMINRETLAFLLLPIYLLTYRNVFKKDATAAANVPAPSIKWALICTAAVVIPYIGLKMLIHPPQPTWFLTLYMNENIPFYEPGNLGTVSLSYLKLIILLGVAAWLALTDLKTKNVFLRSLLIIVPFFIPVHIIVGHVEEYRLWIPLLLIFIPLAIESISNMFKISKA